MHIKYWQLVLLIGFSSSAFSATQTMNLEQFLAHVQNRNKLFQMNQSSREAAQDKKIAGDLSLIPVLSLSGSYLSDKRQPNMMGSTESTVTRYNLGLAKKFSSGTQVKLTGDVAEYANKDISNPAFNTLYGQYAGGSLGLSLSQSLWKDAFGRGTSLRQQRETQIAELEISAVNLQEKQLLIDAESAFWDYIYLQEERQIRESSLQRAKRIENWVARRYRDGIGDRADLMNAKALVASRQMQLLITQDEYLAVQKKIYDWIEASSDEPAPTLVANLDQRRSLKSFISGEGAVVRLDSYMSSLEAKVKDLGSLEAEDSLRSDLVLSANYNTNTYVNQGKLADASRNISRTDTPTTGVSLTWTYLLDTSVKKAALSQVRKEAAAARLKSERRLLESQSSWAEIQRRYDELGKKVEAAKQIAEFQMERAKAEQDKLSKGRSITSQVITSEQDAAEAALNLSKLKVEHRKLEAQGRMFIRTGDKP